EQAIGSPQLRPSEREESTDTARETGEHPGAANIGKQADGDLRHGETRGFADHPVAGTHHQPNSAAHDNAAAPAHHRLRIVVYQIIQAVLDVEESARIPVVPGVARLVVEYRLVDAMQVAAGAERLLTGARQNHEGDGWIVCPGLQLVVQ